MRVLLVDIDSTIPNLALKKCEKYHLDRDDVVAWGDIPLFAGLYDKIYVSCVFTKNKERASEWEQFGDKCLIGGSGYDVSIKLPTEIEAVKPKINWGFTTRGCIRNCPFCFVPKMEGKIRIVGDIYDIWDGESKEIVLLDNNILGLPDHFKRICGQIRKEGLKVDFNQGLDIRLLTDDIARELKSIKTKEIRFAYDNPEIKKTIENKMSILEKYNIKGVWYVLVGVNSNFEEEIGRINYLVENKQRAYVMKHENCEGDRRYTALDRWANFPLFGRGTIPFETYLTETEDGKRYKKHFKQGGV